MVIVERIFALQWCKCNVWSFWFFHCGLALPFCWKNPSFWENTNLRTWGRGSLVFLGVGFFPTSGNQQEKERRVFLVFGVKRNHFLPIEKTIYPTWNHKANQFKWMEIVQQPSSPISKDWEKTSNPIDSNNPFPSKNRRFRFQALWFCWRFHLRQLQ